MGTWAVVLKGDCVERMVWLTCVYLYDRSDATAFVHASVELIPRNHGVGEVTGEGCLPNTKR